MNSVEKSAKTVEEAIQLALTELNVDEDRVEVEVLEQPSKAFLGLIGGKLARVKVTVKEEEEIDPLTVGLDFLQKICDSMKLHVSISVANDGEYTTYCLRGENLGILIGKHGQTLDSLQYLVNLAANRDSKERVRILVDVEDYRKRREDTLAQLALRLAGKVKRTGEQVTLEPMNSHERKIIHMTLQSDLRIKTFSEGNDPFRKVIIALKK